MNSSLVYCLPVFEVMLILISKVTLYSNHKAFNEDIEPTTHPDCNWKRLSRLMRVVTSARVLFAKKFLFWKSA